MARLNSQGHFALDDRGSARMACWLNDTTALFQTEVGPDVWQMATRTIGGTATPMTHVNGGCNDLAAHSGRWMRRLDSNPVPLDGSSPWTPTDGRVGDICATGAATMDAERTTVTLWDHSGAVTTQPIALFGSLRLWDDGDAPALAYTSPTLDVCLRDRFGKPIPCETWPGAYDPIAYREPDGTLWVAYQTDAHGGVLHLATDRTRGYQFGTPTHVYGLDLAPTGSDFCIGWCDDPGQTQTHTRRITLGQGLSEIISFSAPPVPPIVLPPIQPPPFPPEIPVTLPTPVLETIRAFVRLFPPPAAEVVSESYFDEMRDYMQRLCEQVRYAHGETWGHKKSSIGETVPRSKDAVAQFTNGQLYVWDIFLGVGTGAPRLSDDPEFYHVNDQVFLPVEPVNHLAEPWPTSTRPAPRADWVGITSLDLATRTATEQYDWLRDAADEGFTVARVLVARKSGDDPRDYTVGRTQVQTLLQRMRGWLETGVTLPSLELTLVADSRDFGLTVPQIVGHVVACDQMLVQPFTDLIAGVELVNENTHGTQINDLRNPKVLAVLDSNITPSVPLSRGSSHGGESPTFLAGGSYLNVHGDRSLSPEAVIAADAALAAELGTVVCQDEPLGIAEQDQPGRRTSDPYFARRMAEAAKAAGVRYTLHLEAGLSAKVSALGAQQREAMWLVGEVFYTGVPPVTPPVTPPTTTGDAILDAPLTPAYPTGYQFWLKHWEDLEALAASWYTRAYGRQPAPSDIAHGLWRALNEGERWGTVRQAWMDTWPGGEA